MDGNIKTSFLQVDKAISAIENNIGNDVEDQFFMLNDTILCNWHCLNVVVAEMLENYDRKDIRQVLAVRSKKMKCESLRKDVNSLYVKVKQLLGFYGGTLNMSEGRYSIFSKDIKHSYFYDGMLNDEDMRVVKKMYGEDVQDENNASEEDNGCGYFEELAEANNCLKRAAKDFHRLFLRVSSFGEMLFAEKYLSEEEIGELICDGLRAYCSENKKKELRDLRCEAQNYKEKRNKTLTPDEWAKLLEDEEKRIKQTASGILSLSHSGIEDLVMVAKLFPKCCNDEDIFDLDYAMSKGLMYMLTEHNYDKFFCLVLRYNLIQCEMFPEIKPKFNAWIKGKPYDEESVETASEPEDKGPLFTPQAMALWGKLQKAGLVDEELQPECTMRKASMIAKIMGERLGLKPLWQPFEELWNAKNLSKAYYFASVSEYKDSFPEEINKALNIS